MNISSSDLPAFYYDLQSLEPLKQAAAESPEDLENLRSVAQQFESMFMQMVLKSMRSASLGDSLFESKQSLFYRDMFDQQLSVKLAGNGGMGLADLLVEQLSQKTLHTRPDLFAREIENSVAPIAASSLSTAGSTDVVTQPAALRNSAITREAVLPVQQRTESSPTNSSATTTSNGLWERPEDFVRDIWPHAVKAGRELGVDPRVLVAQSALETGWGLKVPKHADGRSSFNLFGIKTGSQWTGDAVVVNTLEFEGDQFVRERSQFRAYSSMDAAMQDYIDFLKTRARYAEALESAADPEKYTRALQDAGYATDPIYADKILRVMGSKHMADGLASLDTKNDAA